MGKETCVCGHDKSEHEKQRSGALVCFHDDADAKPENDPGDGSSICDCMEFQPAEAAKAAGQE